MNIMNLTSQIWWWTLSDIALLVWSKYEITQNKLQQKQFHMYLIWDNHLNNILKAID